MEKVLISACLLGKPVRYNGCGIQLDNPILKLWATDGRIVLICPEVEAGMRIPRTPAEISGGDGMAVINGRADVVDKNGKHVTSYFLNGAHMALQKCKAENIKVALLTESSPSCGSGMIYDGRFSGKKIKGVGVTTALLQQNGVEVFSQIDIASASKRLDELANGVQSEA